jgi:lysozyme
MTTSPAGRALIESFEGCSLKAYLDQRSVPTIGFGHTLGVVMGDTCTPSEADEWLVGDLATAEAAVNRVPAPLTQNQYDALVSLTYNIGSGNFASSTVFKRLSLSPPDYQNAAAAILMWDKTNGEVNPGLVRRRQAEEALFLQSS